jgi:hypothetical protein
VSILVSILVYTSRVRDSTELTQVT